MFKKTLIVMVVALVFPVAASAQWADPADLRFIKDEVVRVTLDVTPAVVTADEGTTRVAEDRPPVPPVPAPARPPIPNFPVPTTPRVGVPTAPALSLKPSPTYNYQGCFVKLNVTGAPNGTVVTYEAQVMDFGAFNEVDQFFTPPFFTVGTATVVNGVATLRVRNMAVSSYLFKATASVGTSNQYPVGWIEQTTPPSPCLV